MWGFFYAMKNLPIYLALIWLLCRLVLGQTDFVENEFSASLMMNMLFLIIAIYFSKKASSFKSNLKNICHWNDFFRSLIALFKNDEF